MDITKPVFRVGKTNHYVQPGDFVWSDIVVARSQSPNSMPVVLMEPISGKVLPNGVVLLGNGTLTTLERCRICEKIIRLE